MDTNEIQTLRREVDTLRNENIALYNELTKQNKILCEELIALRKELFDRTELLRQAIHYFNSQDLRVHLVHAAGMQTAEFIARNMNTTVSFGDKKNYLRHVLNHIESVSGGGVFGIRRVQGRDNQHHLGGETRQNYLRLRQL